MITNGGQALPPERPCPLQPPGRRCRLHAAQATRAWSPPLAPPASSAHHTWPLPLTSRLPLNPAPT